MSRNAIVTGGWSDDESRARYEAGWPGPAHVNEGWGPHSFSEDPEFHCRCQGVPLPDPDEPGAGTDR